MERLEGGGAPRRWYRRADPRGRALLMVLLPLAGVYLCQLVTLQDGAAAWAWMGSHIQAAGYIYLVLLLAQLLLATLTDSLLCAQLLTTLPCLLLAIASHLKQAVNGIPLLVSDLAMAGQAGQVAGFLRPGMSLGAGTWGAIVGMVLLCLAAFAWSHPARPMPWARRLSALAVLAVLLAWALLSPASAALLAGEEGESQAMRNDRLGLLAGLYSAARESTMAEPDAYSEDGMNRILLRLRADAEETGEPEEKPHVILLVSESFFDPTRLPGVEFDADPIPNFHALAEEFPTGAFLSNTYAGGTGNVEMELFIGIPSAFLGAGESLTSIQDPTAYSRVPSLARVFGDAGYETLFVHSYGDILYDRDMNIPRMGFDRLVYQDDFTVDKTYAGGYVSDDTLADELIARFEARGEEPVFLYGLSMENHQPYFAGKFDTPAPVSATAEGLTEEEQGVLDALLHGLWDADASLGKLVDYFSRVEEPVILVFVGDHLPGLSLDAGGTLYTSLGCSSTADTSRWEPEELKRMHTTNILVWNNYGAELALPAETSCTLLGTQLLGWAGVPRPLYFQWVADAGEQMLLYRERLFVAADGSPHHEPTEDCASLVADWKNIVYDMLYGEQYITQALTEPPGS
ncbi:LTA synthase family protein [Flavonifractor sp. An10]|uniref:LTA synthase family protein n=1 Tax=Flavonifractor sp. An10 TaxID=1965537 RepID=UPI000B39CB70|nr:LTA synthase family protein [Flavonifractor sp. An10]OUQ79942.1 arylsulfatase [Flavonifractor sp. An10]